MKTINRSALVVKPAQPFLDWLHRVDPTSTHLTVDNLRLEPTIYLLPEWDTEDEALQLLAEVSNEIFEEQLNGWHRLPSVWPGERDLKSFLFVVRLQFPFDGDRSFFGTPAPFRHVTAEGSKRISGHYVIRALGVHCIHLEAALARIAQRHMHSPMRRLRNHRSNRSLRSFSGCPWMPTNACRMV